MHVLFISWNCIGWQSLILFGVSLISGLRGRPLFGVAGAGRVHRRGGHDAAEPAARRRGRIDRRDSGCRPGHPVFTTTAARSSSWVSVRVLAFAQRWILSSRASAEVEMNA